MRINLLAVLPPLIFAVISGIFAWGMFQDDDLPLALAGQSAPEINLEAMPGRQPFSSEDLKSDGIKLVNFWASWCTPCRAEHPLLTELSNQGIPLYGVNYKDDPEDAAAFLAELGDPYLAIGSDPSGRNGLDWGVIAMPETFLIDGDGKIVLRHAGPITNWILQEKFLPAFQANE